jgi:hypothetical protein
LQETLLGGVLPEPRVSISQRFFVKIAQFIFNFLWEHQLYLHCLMFDS